MTDKTLNQHIADAIASLKAANDIQRAWSASARRNGYAAAFRDAPEVAEADVVRKWNARTPDTHISRSSDYDLQVSKLVSALRDATDFVDDAVKSWAMGSLELENARCVRERIDAALAAFQEASND